MLRPRKSNKRSRRCAARGPRHLPVDRSRKVAQLLLGDRDLLLYVKSGTFPRNRTKDLSRLTESREVGYPPTGAAANARDKYHGLQTSHVTNDYMTPQ